MRRDCNHGAEGHDVESRFAPSRSQHCGRRARVGNGRARVGPVGRCRHRQQLFEHDPATSEHDHHIHHRQTACLDLAFKRRDFCRQTLRGWAADERTRESQAERKGQASRASTTARAAPPQARQESPPQEGSPQDRAQEEGAGIVICAVRLDFAPDSFDFGLDHLDVGPNHLDVGLETVVDAAIRRAGHPERARAKSLPAPGR